MPLGKSATQPGNQGEYQALQGSHTEVAQVLQAILVAQQKKFIIGIKPASEGAKPLDDEVKIFNSRFRQAENRLP